MVGERRTEDDKVNSTKLWNSTTFVAVDISCSVTLLMTLEVKSADVATKWKHVHSAVRQHTTLLGLIIIVALVFVF